MFVEFIMNKINIYQMSNNVHEISENQKSIQKILVSN